MYLIPNARYGKPVVARAVNAWIDVEAPAPLIFRYLTEADFLIKWWCTSCTTDPRPGGAISFEWNGDAAMSGEAIFRHFEPPQRVVLQWTSVQGERLELDGTDRRGMLWYPLNCYELWPLGEGFTRVYLHDMGVGSDAKYDDIYAATCQGWSTSLARLKKTIERSRK